MKKAKINIQKIRERERAIVKEREKGGERMIENDKWKRERGKEVDRDRYIDKEIEGKR